MTLSPFQEQMGVFSFTVTMATISCTETCERSPKSYPVGSNEWKKLQDLRKEKPLTPEEMALKLRQENPDYVDFWKLRWKEHPLNNGVTWQLSVENEGFNKKADWQHMVEMHDAIWRWTKRNNKLPWRGPPKEKATKVIYTKNGDRIETEDRYASFYDGKHKPDDIFTELQLITAMEYNQKYRYSFTFANYEAAFHLTKFLWKSRCIWKKSKDNWAYVIVPTCFQFLYRIAQILDGTFDAETEYHKKLDAWGEYEKKEGRSDIWWGANWEEDNVVKPKQTVYDGEEVIKTGITAPPLSEEVKEESEISFDLNEAIDRYEELEMEEPMEVVDDEFQQCMAAVSLEPTGETVTLDEVKTEEPKSVVQILLESYYGGKDKEAAEIEPQSGSEEMPQMLPPIDDLLEEDGTWEWKVIAPPKTRKKRINFEWPFRWYPKVQRFPVKHTRNCKAETEYLSLPIFTPEEMKRNYFENLPDIYLRIGRPELAERCCCEPVRNFWNEKRRQFRFLEDDQMMNLLYDRFQDISRRRGESPERDNTEFDDLYEVQSGTEPPPAVKSAAPPAGGGKSGGPVTGAEEVEKPIKKGEKHVTMTFVDQREVQKTAPDKIKEKAKEDDHSVNEIYDMMKVVKRPMFIDRRTWTVDDTNGKEILRWVLPQVYFSEASSQKVACGALNASYILSMFGAAKFDMMIRMNINSVKFQQGRLVAVWKPFYMADKELSIFNNLTQFPHCFIDASTSNSVELKIPWTNPRDAFPIYTDPNAEMNYFGTFHLYVWNRLKTGKTGSTDTSLSVYMWLENLKTYQLTNPKDPSKVHFATDIVNNKARFLTSGTTSAYDKHAPLVITTGSVKLEPQAGLMEGILGAGADIAMETGANMMEKLLQQFARGHNAKPSGFQPPQPVIPMVASNASFGEGVDLSQRLSLEPLSVQRPDKSVSEPANMKDLIEKWSRFAVMNWDINNDENAVIGAFPMCPMIPADIDSVARLELYGNVAASDQPDHECEPANNKYATWIVKRNNTMLDFLSRAFHFWRGSLNFRFEAVCTSMHSGRLWIRYEPYGTRKSATQECEKQATPGILWDIQEKHEIDVNIPYSSVQPYLSTQWLANASDQLEGALGNFACGFVELTVQNRLKVTTGISDEISINVYIAAGPDFEFFVPAPLDGIMSFREWDYGVVTTDIPERSIWNVIGKITDDMWKIQMKQNPSSTQVIEVGGKKWRRMINNYVSNWWYLPFYRLNGASYFDREFVTLMGKFHTYAKAEGIHVPNFGSWDHAYSWLNSHPKIMPKEWLLYMQAVEIEESPLVWEKLLHWGTLVILKENFYMVRSIPRMYVTQKDDKKHLLGFADPPAVEKAEEKVYEVQSNTKSTVTAINPFSTFKPEVNSTKELSGENHMNIYKIMKRWSMWKTTTIPWPCNDLRENADFVKNSYGWIMRTLNSMQSWEKDAYVWEFRIPVTPMTKQHFMGMRGQWLSDIESSTGSKYLGADDLAKAHFDGGMDIGSEAGLTVPAFYGQMFRFWRGSMRYRFTFPGTRNDNLTWAVVVYNPMQVTDADAGPGLFRLSTKRQMRQIMNQGSVMWNGNVMANIDVEVPYYSRYSRLYTSMERYDMFSTAGSLFVYVPLDFELGNPCKDATTKDMASKIKALEMWISIAVADDFEFQVPVDAPSSILWPTYSRYQYSQDMYYGEFDKFDPVKPKTGNIEVVPRMAVRKLTEKDTTHQIRSVEAVVSPLGRRWIPLKKDSVKNLNFAYGLYELPSEAQYKEQIQKKDCIKICEEPKEEGKAKKKYEVQAGDEPPAAVSTLVPPSEKPPIVTQGDDEIDGMLTDACNTMKNLNSLVGTASEKIGPFLEKISAAADTIEKKTETLASSVCDTSGVVKKGIDYAINGTRLGAFFYGIHSMLKAETWQERWFPMATCALALGLSPEVVTKAGEWLMSNVSGIFSSEKVHEKNEPQAWEDIWNNDILVFLQENSGTLRMIAAGIATILTFYFTPSLPSTCKVKSFAIDMVNKLRNVAFVGAGLKTLDWMFKWVAGCIKDGALWVADMFSGGLITANRLSAHYPEVLQWLSQVEKYDLEAYKGPLNWNHDARIELWKCMDAGKKLTDKLASKAGPLYNTLTKGMLKLTKIDDEAKSVKNAPAFRMDPIHICFYGKAGVKKSSILTYVLGFIADELGYPVHNRFYARCEQEEHWNGYNGQLITICDDIAQIKDGKAIEELISMKSNICWHVPMAHLEDKGKCFTSKIIGSTTNTLFPRPENISNYPALWRRRNVLVEVIQSFADTESTAGTWKNLRFNIIEPQPDQNGQDLKKVLKANLTMVELMTFLLASTKKWIEKQNSIVFAGLQGKSIDIPDYGEIPLNGEVVSTAKQVLQETLRKGIVMSLDRLKEAITCLSMGEISEIFRDERCEKTMGKIPGADTYITMMKLAIRAWELLAMTLAIEVETVRHWSLKELAESELKQFYQLKENPEGLLVEASVVANGIPIMTKYLNWTAGFKPVPKPVLVNKDEVDLAKLAENAQAPQPSLPRPGRGKEEDLVVEAGGNLVDEITNEVDTDFRRQYKELEDAKNRAQDSLSAREDLLTLYEDIIRNTINTPSRFTRVRLSNEQEISTFIAHNYPKLTSEEAKELAKNFKTAFDSVQKRKETWTQFACNEATMINVSKLFEEPFKKYWKKDKDQKHYVFECSGESEEELEAYSLFSVLEDKYTAEEIDKMVEAMPKPEQYRISKLYSMLENFYTKQKKKITDWFEQHPLIVKMFKLASALVGIFVGYKILDWVCPSIVGKIKAGFAALFGWGVSKVGEERYEQWKNKGKELATKGKNILKMPVDWVKQLMSRSNDAEIREWSEDPDMVELYAESLSGIETNVKNSVKMKARAVPEGKARLRIHAYSVGSDKVHESASKCKQFSNTASEVPVYEVEGCSDPNALNLRVNILAKSMVRAYWANSEKAQSLTGLMIKGRYLLIPHHFWDGCPRLQPFVLTNKSGACYWEIFDPSLCRKIPEQDLSVFLCSKRIGQFVDLTKHFPNTDEIRCKQTPASLMSMTPDCVFSVQHVNAEQVYDVNYKLDSGERIHNINAWEYDATTEKGDCGSILVADNTAQLRKILGLHVCGIKDQNYGTAAYVSRDELFAAMEALPEDSKVLPLNYVPECLITKGIESMQIKPFGNFDLHGAVDNCNAVRLPHKTEIQPSPIHDMVREHVTEPAVLTMQDPRLKVPGSPLIRALEKYGNPTIPFPKEDVKLAFNHIKSEVMYWKLAMPARKLTDWEAVFGNETIDYCDRMNLGASPGYPWTLSRPSGEKGKAYLFDINNEDGIACEDFRKHYQLREKLAQKGIRKVSVWTDCLKDERRPLEKIAKGKTRAFMLPPADFVMLCRKYFMAFCCTFYSNRINSFSAVGIDPYSYEWTRLVRKLKKNSNLAFGGDFHAFDGIFDPLFLWEMCLMICEWYRKNDPNWCEEDDKVRHVLFEEMIHTVHISKNSIYQKHQGNPSGNPLTVILNTFAHFAYLIVAWIGLARRHAPEMMSLYYFWKYVMAIIYGDDGVYTVKREVAEWFNCETVSAYLKEFGIEYTDELKSGILYGVKPLYECTFLKNGFKKMQGEQYWLAPISQDTIYELTNWVKKSDDPVDQLRANLADVFSFAFHHGEEFFRELLVKVNDALEKRGLKTFVTSFEHEKERFLAKCLN